MIQWNPNDAGSPPGTPPPLTGPLLNPNQISQLTPPPVPTEIGGAGETAVNTPSMDVFASNIGKLVAPVQDALSQLGALSPIAAGAFADAYNVQNKVSGNPNNSKTSSTSDLVSSYKAVLQDLAQGLTDVQSATQKMSKTYTTTNDLNNMNVTDLKNDLNAAQGDFGNMMSANGGNPNPGGGNPNPSGGS